MISDQVRSGSTSAETFRGTLRGHTPDGHNSTVIVTRQGLGSESRVWLTFDGGIRTTVVMTDDETGELIALLDKATGRTGGPKPPAGSAR
jgi:hypothetical protein